MVTQQRPWPLEKQCRECGAEPGSPGFIRKSGDQNCLYCSCGKYNYYNVPKAKTGEPVNHIKTRADLKPGQRTRILERDGAACLLCKRSDTPLHIAHVLSVHDIKQHNIINIAENDDANLFVCCQECNLDMRERSVEAQIFLHLIAVRTRRGQQS